MTNRLTGLRDSERFAALTLERATGATATAYDVGGLQGVHDFTLTYPDGRTAAVEKTSHAGPGARQLEALLDGGSVWPNPGQWLWTVTVSGPADVPRLREVYRLVIVLCEQHGVRRADLLPRGLLASDPKLAWLETSGVSFLGQPDLPAIQGVRRWPVYVLPPSGAGAVDKELTGLDAAVADVLAVSGVVRRVEKVSRADADERHLYLAVDFTGLPTPVALALMDMPEGFPATSTLTLPGRLTHLWFAPRYLHLLLRWTTSGGWQAHEMFGSPDSA